MADMTELSRRVGELTGSLDSLNDSFQDHREENRLDHESVMSILTRVESKMDGKLEKHDDRLKSLENHRWWQYGAAAALVFFIAYPHVTQLLVH